MLYGILFSGFFCCNKCLTFSCWPLKSRIVIRACHASYATIFFDSFLQNLYGLIFHAPQQWIYIPVPLLVSFLSIQARAFLFFMSFLSKLNFYCSRRSLSFSRARCGLTWILLAATLMTSCGGLWSWPASQSWQRLLEPWIRSDSICTRRLSEFTYIQEQCCGAGPFLACIVVLFAGSGSSSCKK